MESLLEPIATRIRLLLASTPDPEEARRYLVRMHRESPGAFDRFAVAPRLLRYLLTVFSYSRFLSEAILRRPEAIAQLTAAGSMNRAMTAEEYEGQLLQFLGAETGAPPPLLLARFRRRQILRIMLRDVLRLASLAEITEELSNLADALLDVVYRRLREHLGQRHGEPDGEFSIMALGKLGGKELNYSSDIDLMFLYSPNGETAGPEPVSYKEFFKKLANQFTDILSTYTAEGMCYRIDLRLRPDGTLGEVCTSLEGAKSYYKTRARDWELQMLIKARVAAGDPRPGKELLEFVEPLIYNTSTDFRALEAVSEARERISEKLAAKRGGDGALDVKLARGGIRDIEFLVQCLQRLHGGREPWVRHGGTLFALFRLRDKSLLSVSEYARLAAAYQFLRNLEHRLQLEDDRQTHVLPQDPEMLAVLARKMPPDQTVGEPTADTLERQLQEHFENVRELYDRVIYAQRPGAPARPELLELRGDAERLPARNITRFLDQRAPRLATVLAKSKLRRGRERFEHFLEMILAQPEWLARIDSDAALAESVVDIFEHSQYFGDQLLRHPHLLGVLNEDYRFAPGSLDESAAVRQFFHEQMLRIQSDSILRSTPIFTTLERTSELADTAIGAAYRIALGAISPPPAYTPAEQMMVVALGRLGMREFDLASDADLIFVIPDADAPATLFWTQVAEKMVNTISAYTGAGVLFTVDTRLRPNGREGALVQTEGTYQDYFARRAEAWEGITYMKARAVAGNVDRATEFLHELQRVDWRRYGQSGRSRKELAQMRARLEKEQGARNPLKAGLGGYYDIDFALMYLRLKGAGIFYKVLNTPERINVIEQMGHLEPDDAEFLREAATLYRAIDHGLRVATGHAGGSLPTAQAQFEILSELVRRWTPAHLHEARLDVKLQEIRQKTRAFFNSVFGE